MDQDRTIKERFNPIVTHRLVGVNACPDELDKKEMIMLLVTLFVTLEK